MDFENLLVEKTNRIAWVKLNRPDKLNALNRQLIIELITALQTLDNDESVDVIIIKGEGRGFCAGMDLKEHPLGGGVVDDIVATYGPWQTIEELNKPTIAAVHGYAITGGNILAMACDIVIASEDAKFADTHARWGLIPYGGEPAKLVRSVGIKKAKEMMFTSEMISALEAEEFGLINKVVPLDELDTVAQEMAEKIIQNSQRAVKTIKRLINVSADLGFTAGLKIEEIIGRRGQANIDPDEDRDKRLSRFRKQES
jgi:enoyl-CoA hydratase/carnithine racemase